MDQAQERLAALSRTQQALLDKINALEEAEQLECAPLTAPPSPRIPNSAWVQRCTPLPPTPPLITTSDDGEPPRVEEVEAAPVRPSHDCSSLRTAAPSGCTRLSTALRSLVQGGDDEEQALLAMLMQKQAELQKMRAAIDELKQMDANVTVRRRCHPPPS